jgi:hypothetical protein
MHEILATVLKVLICEGRVVSGSQIQQEVLIGSTSIDEATV